MIVVETADGLGVGCSAGGVFIVVYDFNISSVVVYYDMGI